MIYNEKRKVNLLVRALRNEAPDWLVEHLKIHYPSDFEGARNKLLEFEQEQDEDGLILPTLNDCVGFR